MGKFEDNNLHVIGISESWLHDSLPNGMFELPNHNLYRLDRNWKDIDARNIKKGGGVGLFINKNLHSNDKDFEKLNCSSKHIECQWVSIKQNNCKKILIGNLYRPPQGDIDSFIRYLETVFDIIEINNVELFLMGDFNIDFMDKKDFKCKKLLELMKPLDLRQLIKEPTRPTIHKSSCLDLIFTNCDNICKAGVINMNISDHLPILLTRKNIKIAKPKCTFTGRSYRIYNKDNFQRKIREADWLDFDNSDSVAKKWDCLIDIVKRIIDEMCPLKLFKIKQEKEPWISNQLIELIKDKDYALKRATKSKDPLLWAESKRLRNNCTKRLRDARADYIKDNLDNNTGNQKKFWKIFKI